MIPMALVGNNKHTLYTGVVFFLIEKNTTPDCGIINRVANCSLLGTASFLR